MPPRDQRNTVLVAAVGGHVANCATDTDNCPNRGGFALAVSKSAVRSLTKQAYLVRMDAPQLVSAKSHF
jgi:hypothetical protein